MEGFYVPGTRGLLGQKGCMLLLEDPRMPMMKKGKCLGVAMGGWLVSSLLLSCAMQPVYLGYEVDLEEESSSSSGTTDAQEPGDSNAEKIPDGPEFELTKRECRKLVRRYYSECRQDCFDDERECIERCEREARGFMRACLERAKKEPRPDGKDKNPDSEFLDKSKAFLKSDGDENASTKS